MNGKYCNTLLHSQNTEIQKVLLSKAAIKFIKILNELIKVSISVFEKE